MSLEKPTISAKVDPVVKAAFELMATRRGTKAGTWLKDIAHEELVMAVVKETMIMVGFSETYQRLQRPSSYMEQGQLFELERTGGCLIPPVPAKLKSSIDLYGEPLLRQDVQKQLKALGPVELCLRLTHPGYVPPPDSTGALCSQCCADLEHTKASVEGHGLLKAT